MVGGANGFASLLDATLIADSGRGNGAVAHLQPKERLAAMLAKLEADASYEDDYRRFVEGMAFAASGEVPSYAAAVAAMRRFAEFLA